MAYNYKNQYEPYEVEVTISSAKDLKNVNWRYGPLKPYAVVWVTPNTSNKSSTNVDPHGDANPVWDEKLTLPLTAPVDDSTLSIDVVHADAADDTKPLIGSARLPLRDVLDNSGVGERVHRSLTLKRPSGRPHGCLDVKILLRRQPSSYHPPPGHYAPAYGVPPPENYYGGYGSQPPPPVVTREYSYGSGGYGSVPPVGQPAYYGGGGSAAPSYGYGGEAAAAYGGGVKVEEKKKSGKFGVGTGLAVGAVAGVLGGLVLAEGMEHAENKIAEKVEDDLRNDYGGGGGYDDYGGDDY